MRGARMQERKVVYYGVKEVQRYTTVDAGWRYTIGHALLYCTITLNLDRIERGGLVCYCCAAGQNIRPSGRHLSIRVLLRCRCWLLRYHCISTCDYETVESKPSFAVRYTCCQIRKRRPRPDVGPTIARKSQCGQSCFASLWTDA